MPDKAVKKHPCPDCLICQWCSDERCRICLGQICCHRRKLSIAEQIALYESRNNGENNELMHQI
ncbi:MAG TPA: hypothetical protein HPP97_13630 [Desulfuromonadales bacterium]|nr:hypothetical protein [Desulfuromonadales bacterium]